MTKRDKTPANPWVISWGALWIAPLLIGCNRPSPPPPDAVVRAEDPATATVSEPTPSASNAPDPAEPGSTPPQGSDTGATKEPAQAEEMKAGNSVDGPVADAPQPEPDASGSSSGTKSAAAAPAPRSACDPAYDCCSRDSDCVALDKANPCSCPPCGDEPRYAVNKRGAASQQGRWSRRRCVSEKCEPCTGRYVGEAACVSGRCTIR